MRIKDKEDACYVQTEYEECSTTTTWSRYELMDYSLIKKYLPSIYKEIKKKRKLKD